MNEAAPEGGCRRCEWTPEGLAEAEGLRCEWTDGGVNGRARDGVTEAEKNCFRPAPPTFRPMIFRKTETPRPDPSATTGNSKLPKFDNCQKMESCQKNDNF